MILIYSFIGRLPSYIIETIYQVRLYYNGDIYLILDDIHSEYIKRLVIDFNVRLINYIELTKGDRIIEQLQQNFNKFVSNYKLPGREYLFYRSFERLFIVNSLITKLNLEDVLSLELDNLIYDDPRKWLEGFKQKSLAYMECDTVLHNSCGIIYIKNKTSLLELLDYMLYYVINNVDEFNSEMRSLYNYTFKLNKNDFQLLPIRIDKINSYYGNSVFDPASYGIYLLGRDVVHTNGVLTFNMDMEHHIVKCSDYKYEWREIDGLRKPFIYNEKEDNWILINNLHVHSKRLDLGLSKPLPKV